MWATLRWIGAMWVRCATQKDQVETVDMQWPWGRSVVFGYLILEFLIPDKRHT